MALKQKIVTVTEQGDDFGKQFRITRMSAVEADKWGRHAMQAAMGSGGDIPGVMAGSGLAGVAAAGLNIFACMPPEKMDDLLDRLMECVGYIPDPARPDVTLTWQQAKSQIEEIPTVGWLQKEAFSLHTDFFKGVGQLFSLISLLLQAGNIAPTPDMPTSATP